MVDIQEWVAKAKTTLQHTTSMLSSMEEVIREQGMDEKVIKETHTGLLSTMGEISKLADLLGDIELKVGDTIYTESRLSLLSYSDGNRANNSQK